MPGEIATGVAVVAEKVAEGATVVKTAEVASLATKIAKIAESATKEGIKKFAIGKTVSEVVNVADEIDESIGNAAKVGLTAIDIINVESVSDGISKVIEQGISKEIQEDPELAGIGRGIKTGQDIYNGLKKKFETVVENSQNRKAVNWESKPGDMFESFNPNSTIEMNGRTFETDDNGLIYKMDGYELMPNQKFMIDGVEYTTDDLARVMSCKTTIKKITPEQGRDGVAQKIAGGEDRKIGDEGGHILARIFGGATGIENMMALRGYAINHSVYGKMENEIRKAVESGQEVPFDAKIEYDGNSKRASKITVKYSIDGQDRVYQFDNNEGSKDLLNDVQDKIEQSDYDDLAQEIADAEADGANMSVISLKTIYDENGNLNKIIVTIRDENDDRPVNEDRVFNPKEV